MSRPEQVEDLLRAFAARDLDAIRVLADAGADLDAAGGGGLTPLMRAVLRGDMVAVEWILAAGADPDVRTGDGKAALDFARELGRDGLVELLVAAGAEVPAGVETEGLEAPLPTPVSRPTLEPPASVAPPAHRQPARFSDQRPDVFADEIDDMF